MCSYHVSLLFLISSINVISCPSFFLVASFCILSLMDCILHSQFISATSILTGGGDELEGIALLLIFLFMQRSKNLVFVCAFNSCDQKKIEIRLDWYDMSWASRNQCGIVDLDFVVTFSSNFETFPPVLDQFLVVSVLDSQSRDLGFKSRPGQKFGSRFLLHLHPKPTQLWWVQWPYTVSGKMRRWGRGLATSPHMSRLRKWSR